ncbi:MAG: hypothetical protein IJK04_11660 [Kiritimatiellae bacterium]|nr:hypothetical protein [Kiritimatiellia bacterium]
MPYALTLHDIPDDLYAALRADAEHVGTSMNKAAKALLASALGLLKPARPNYADAFRALAGAISDEEAAEMREAVAECRTIDRKDWQ